MGSQGNGLVVCDAESNLYSYPESDYRTVSSAARLTRYLLSVVNCVFLKGYFFPSLSYTSVAHRQVV